MSQSKGTKQIKRFFKKLRNLFFIAIIFTIIGYTIPIYFNFYRDDFDRYVDFVDVIAEANDNANNARVAITRVNPVYEQIKSTVARYNKDNSEEFAKLVYDNAIRVGIDPLFLASIITTESHWRPNVVSPKNAVGLGQITPITAKELGVKHSDMFDPAENIKASANYLAKLQKEFKTKELTAAAYNAGPTKVRELGRIPRFKETLNYVDKVNREYNSYNIAIKR